MALQDTDRKDLDSEDAKSDNDKKSLNVDAARLPRVDAPSKRVDSAKRLVRTGMLLGFVHVQTGCPATETAVELDPAADKADGEPAKADEKAPADLPKEAAEDEAPVKDMGGPA